MPVPPPDDDAPIGPPPPELGVDQPIRLLYGAELAEPLPDLPHLVREIGLVAGGGAPHLVAGYGYSGKTLAMQALILALAAGAKVWGTHSIRQAYRVVHVDKEQGSRLTKRRYQRLARAMGIDLASLGEAIGAAIFPPLTLSGGCADQWKRIMDGRDLVLVDSLRAATPGQDENSSDIRTCLDMLGEVSEQTQCRAVVIHHARKPSEDSPGGRYSIRGSGAIYDAIDVAYVFSGEKGEPIKVANEKARSEGELVPDFALVVSDVAIERDPKGGLRVDLRGAELIAQRREENATAARRVQTSHDVVVVRQALATRPGMNVSELRAAVPLGKDRMTAALLALGDTVEVRPMKEGRVTAMRHYLRGAS